MEKYKKLFFEKFSENISIIQAQLVKCISNEARPADLDVLIRIFHNIKSDAGIMGYQRISRISRLTEELLRSSKEQNTNQSKLLHSSSRQLYLVKKIADFFQQICREGDREMAETTADRITIALEQALDQEIANTPKVNL